MSINKYSTLLFFLCFSIVLNAQEYRVAYELKIPLVKKLMFEPQIELKQKNYTVSDNKILVFDNSLSYKLNKKVKLAAGYMISSGYMLTGLESAEDAKQRANIDFNYRFSRKSNPIEIEYRCRLQSSQSPEKGLHKFYQRNRIQLKYELNNIIQPSVSDEVYIDLDEFGIDFNRIRFGIETSITKNTELDLYFINEMKFENVIQFYYIAGATFCMKF
jgi:hypothetical protein